MPTTLNCLAAACFSERVNAFYCELHTEEDRKERVPLNDRLCALVTCSTRVRGDSLVCVLHRGRAFKYGLSPEQLVALVGLMDGCCYICQTAPGVAIDHAHDCCSGGNSCGKCVRGWLCERCNRLLGQVRDSKPRLMRLSFSGTLERDVYLRAIQYLQAYGEFRARVDGTVAPTLDVDFEIFKAASELVWKGTAYAAMVPAIVALGVSLGVES